MPKASTKLQGFLREYCISLHLSCHPCIVGLFGIAFQSNEHYCFAQELVIGRDLFAVIQPKVNLLYVCGLTKTKPVVQLDLDGNQNVYTGNTREADTQMRHGKNSY